MADLDDFFAKKDRKKSKSVKKFATADELAKKLEEPKLKSDVRPKKERPAQEGEESGRAGVRIRSKMFRKSIVSQGCSYVKSRCSSEIFECYSENLDFIDTRTLLYRVE